MVASVERRIWFWSAIGPLMVLMSAALCGCKGGAGSLSLLAVGVVGVPLSLLWEWRGLALSSLLLFLSPLLVSLLGSPFPPYVAGLSLVMGLGFLLSVLGRDEAARLIAERKEPIRETVPDLERERQLLDQIAHLEAQFEESEEGRKQERQLRCLAQGNLERLERDRVQDTHRLRSVKEEAEAFRQRVGELKGLRHKLNAARVELFQKRLDLKQVAPSDSPELSQLRAQLEAKEKELFAARYALEERERTWRETRQELPRVREVLAERLRSAREAILFLKGYRDRYRQLRGQFAEKQQELDKARRDLFRLEEERMVQEREERVQEVSFDESVEIEQLQELVGELLEELASRSCLSFREDFAAVMSH